MQGVAPTVIARRYLDDDLDVIETDWVRADHDPQTGRVPSDLKRAIERAERETVSDLLEPGIERVETELAWPSSPDGATTLSLFAEEYTTGAAEFEGVVETVINDPEPDNHTQVVRPEDEETLEAALSAVLQEAAASGVVEAQQWEVAADGDGTSWTVQVDPN
ncbi:MAG: hypothetical protein ACQEQJ_07610 [Halobacteriota archaeon]